MEREDGFSGYPNKIARTSTALTLHPRHDSAINTTVNVNNNHLNEQQQVSQTTLPACIIREQDQYKPMANVIRIMRRILPPHAKISDNTVQECVSEYVSFVTGEANARCHREQRQIITAEDVIWAMGKLGFDNCMEPLSLFLSRYRERECAYFISQGAHFEERSGWAFWASFQCGPPARFYDSSVAGSFKDGSGSFTGSCIQSNLPGFAPFAPFK